MRSSPVEITTSDGVADAYLARPDDRPHPGVLVITDAFGLRPTIEEMADRIAADGAAYLDFLQQVASPGPVAITGYCRAGAWAGRSRPPTLIGSRRSPASTPAYWSPTPLTARTARPPS
jgi:dienelactone hydrolase